MGVRLYLTFMMISMTDLWKYFIISRNKKAVALIFQLVNAQFYPILKKKTVVGATETLEVITTAEEVEAIIMVEEVTMEITEVAPITVETEVEGRAMIIEVVVKEGALVETAKERISARVQHFVKEMVVEVILGEIVLGD